MRCYTKLVSFFLVSACLAVGANLSQAAMIPEDGILNFAVIRDGEKIGTHVLSFRQANDRIDVDIKTKIAVKFAFITVFRFDHDGHEVWQNGKLVRMETRTHDDGTDHTLQVSMDGTDRLRVIGDGTESVAATDSVPASLWNPAFIRKSPLMNSIIGKPLDIKIAYKGEETVIAKGKPVKARHYSMTGEFSRELWYDQDWVLVRMALKGKDGSDIQYVLN